MFGLFAPETVSYIDVHSGMFTFLSKKKRSLGGSSKVRVVVPRSPKPLTLDIPVSLVNVRHTPAANGYVCVGHVLIDEARYPQLEQTLKTIPVSAALGMAARRSARYPVSLRVMSRELPGFGAVTVDISHHGVRLSCHGPVAEGREIRVTIELDVGSMSSHLTLPARVVWSRPDPRGKGCFVGAEFLDGEPAAYDLLNRYIKSLADRMGGDVMHRTIADGEVFVRPDDNLAKPGS